MSVDQAILLRGATARGSTTVLEDRAHSRSGGGGRYDVAGRRRCLFEHAPRRHRVLPPNIFAEIVAAARERSQAVEDHALVDGAIAVALVAIQVVPEEPLGHRLGDQGDVHLVRLI